MQVFDRIPFLRGLMVVWAGYGLVWIVLEGSLRAVMVMGVLSTAVSILYFWQKRLAGKVLSKKMFVLGTAVSGFAFGLGSAILGLIFMAVKTGLHAHGPEFSQAEIEWVIVQIPLWSAVGLLLGLGVGLLVVGTAE